MKLSIVIVSWNVRDLLAECLASVHQYSPESKFEIVIVDNASTDGSQKMIQSQFPQVKLIQSEVNLGFAGGNNLAIRQCQGTYVLLLNPDTAVKPGALTTLVNFMEAHPEAGAAGSRLLNPDGSLQHPSCHPKPTLARELWRLLHLDAVYPFAVYRMQDWPLNVSREVDVLQGASFIVRQSVLGQIGLLDDGYFMYSEEVDLCLRIQRAGWKLFWVPASQVVHYGGQSTRQSAPEMFQQLYGAKLRYFRKHYGRFAGQRYKLVLTAASLLRLALTPLAWLQRRPQRDQNIYLGKQYWRLLRSLPGM